jgi:hypothetical protein
MWWIIFESQQKHSVAWVRERTIPTEQRRLSAKLVPTFADREVPRGQRGVTPMDGRILGSEPLLVFHMISVPLNSDMRRGGGVYDFG